MKYNLTANPDEMIYKEINKKVYNDFLKNSRYQRVTKQTREHINEKMRELNDRLREMGLIQDNKSTISIDDDDEPKKNNSDAPVDAEFMFGINQKARFSPRLALPAIKDTLYVDRPLGSYEPLRVMQPEDFKDDPNAPLRKPFSEEGEKGSHKVLRDTVMELNGESLQKIWAGPRKIDFGMIFVKSQSSRTFTVRNDLRNCISVRLETPCEELRKSNLVKYLNKHIFYFSQS